MRIESAPSGAEKRQRLRRLRLAGGAAWIALIAAHVAMAAMWKMPAIFPLLYAASSLIALAVYGVDKNAAQRGGWRVKESTLHFWGLAFGWPGAIVGQLLWRHKTQKNSFRGIFWLTVVLNLGLFVYLNSPEAPPELRAWLDSISLHLLSRLGLAKLSAILPT